MVTTQAQIKKNRWRKSSHGTQVALYSFLTIAALVLFTLSPLALQELGSIRNLDWSRLSNIGQSYGAPAALLTVLAVGGVAAALFVQIRDSRINREQTARTFHLELVRMALDNPDFRDMMSSAGSDPRQEGQRAYANLWMAYWLALFRMKYLNEPELRLGLSSQVFRSYPGRDMWRQNRDNYFATAVTDRRAQRFYRIVEDEFGKLGPLDSRLEIGTGETGLRHQRDLADRRYVTVILAAGIGLALGRVMNNRQIKALSAGAGPRSAG